MPSHDSHHPARRAALAAMALAGVASASARQPLALDALVAELRAAEMGFAQSMATRSLDAFASFIAEDAIFINGGKPLRGKPVIAEYWSKFFSGATAPFAWRPEIVEVAAQLDLGYTEGPVLSPAGAILARFFSTWQRQTSGKWLVVFDNGYDICKPTA